MIAVYARNQQGERRVSPSLYRLLLTAHIITSVGWLGVVFAKVVLGSPLSRPALPPSPLPCTHP